MNVSLTPRLEKFVHKLVKSGEYQSASEVVREGLRKLAQDEQERDAKLKALQRDVDQALRSSRQGKSRSLDIEAIKEKARRTYNAELKRHG